MKDRSKITDRCRRQKRTKEGLWDSYCIRAKDHEGSHIHKPYVWWLKKGYM